MHQGAGRKLAEQIETGDIQSSIGVQIPTLLCGHCFDVNIDLQYDWICPSFAQELQQANCIVASRLILMCLKGQILLNYQCQQEIFILTEVLTSNILLGLFPLIHISSFATAHLVCSSSFQS